MLHKFVKISLNVGDSFTRLIREAFTEASGGQTTGRMWHAPSVYEARKSSPKAVNSSGPRHIDCGRCLKGEIK